MVTDDSTRSKRHFHVLLKLLATVRNFPQTVNEQMANIQIEPD